ncbi:MAG: ATP-binding protein [Abditibacteriales bacterium]|nr:ATP-binding protein [Abditibacteriales bacterium]MDW8366990.1 ATP-binding protein [Abditibacteriales bacterium]
MKNDRENRVDISIPSDTEFVRVVRLAVSGVASRLSFSYDDIEDIKLAVSEACNNAIQHASPNGDSRVLVQCLTAPDRLTIIVHDSGSGVPRAAWEKSLTPPDEWDERGLGLVVMQALMDEVHFESRPPQGHQVRLVKYVKR